MRIDVHPIADGPGPSERTVGVRAFDGSVEEVTVSVRAVRDGRIEVGHPVSVRPGQCLVELPRESIRGVWRVWVSDPR